MPHILLVEDNKDLREDFTELFSLSGFDVTPAADGQEALVVLKQHHIDLIISDYDMPNMNGYELLQAARAIDQYKALPFLMISGAHIPSLNGDAHFLFLRKPVRIEKLIQEVEKLIAN